MAHPTASVTTTLNSAASTSTVLGQRVDVYLYDSSSFAGTWQVRSKINGRSCIVATGTEADLPVAYVVESAKAREVDVNIPSSPTGTLGVEIAA